MILLLKSSKGILRNLFGTFVVGYDDIGTTFRIDFSFK